MNVKGLSAFGLIAVAIVVALGSAAFACTELKGKIAVTGTGGTTGSGSLTGTGSDGLGVTNLLAYGTCEGFPFDKNPIELNGGTGTIRIDVSPGPASGCGAGLKVPDYSSWQVIAAVDSGGADDIVNCHPPYPATKPGIQTLMGTMTTSGGSGTGNYTLPGPGAYNICVAEDPGNQIPYPGSNQSPPMLSVLYI